MAWTTFDATSWSDYAVYEEKATGSGTQTKTFQVSVDAGANQAIRPRFIELNYAAVTGGVARAITVTHIRGGDTFHTMLLDDACEIAPTHTRRIFFHTGRNTPDNQFSTSVATVFDHMHTLMPMVLLPGDALRFTTANSASTDTMMIYIHADVLPPRTGQRS